MLKRSGRRVFALHYVNGDVILGRFDKHWTRTGELQCAAIFDTYAEADNARQALMAEAHDRMNSGDRQSQFWADIYGGLTVVIELFIETRMVDEPPAVDAVDPHAGTSSD